MQHSTRARRRIALLSAAWFTLQFVWQNNSKEELDDYSRTAWLMVVTWLRLTECVCVMQVVHSRTFGTAAKEGGTAVHMLLPLVDFLNHGGDETECFPGDPFAPTANVRWAVPFCSSSCLCVLLLLCESHF